MLTGVLGLGVGDAGLAAGVLSLSTEFGAEDRLRRLTTAEEEGMDERELGRFEGELRSYADNARVTRPFLVAADVGLALGGGLAMVFTAGSNHLPEAERFIGLVFGGDGGCGGARRPLEPARRVPLRARLAHVPRGPGPRRFERGSAPRYASPNGAGVMAAGMF